jgi:hypothetical protein
MGKEGFVACLKKTPSICLEGIKEFIENLIQNRRKWSETKTGIYGTRRKRA